MKINWAAWRDRFLHLRLPGAAPTVPSGVYHFRKETPEAVTRFHLRVEEDGTGLLLANSCVAARLSPSGVFIAKGILEGKDEEHVLEGTRRSFRQADEQEVRSDIAKVRDFVATLAAPEDNFPIFNLDDPSVSTPKRLMAPFQAQMPIGSREQVLPLLKRLWDSGIMQVNFQALSASSVDDAVLDIECAEDTGMISGLRAAGGWMGTHDAVERCAGFGVDYITVPVISTDKQKHDRWMGPGDFAKALKCFAECRELDVCPVAEVPLFRENVSGVKELLELLESHGVNNVLYYAISSDYHPSGLSPAEIIHAAAGVEELSNASRVRYVWQPPVSRKGDLPVILEEGPRTAGDVAIRVDLDGFVYPPRGPLVAAGNLITDDWRSIWNSEPFRRYRDRVQTPTRCDICPGLEICAADCPGDRRGWATDSDKEGKP